MPLLWRRVPTADLNNDGKVTLDEALAHGKQMFEFHDRNKDGVITRDEVPVWVDPIAQADSNNDGKVTYVEHEAMLRTHLARWTRTMTAFSAVTSWRARRRRQVGLNSGPLKSIFGIGSLGLPWLAQFKQLDWRLLAQHAPPL